MVHQILKRETPNAENNTALNYAIQKLYISDNLVEHPSGNYTVPHLSYDFNDYLGENDMKQLLVTKMLQTGKGQCHSMPLFYLCLAEQLPAKAYLSLAPNHTFIEFFDDHGKLYNFETTNGHLVSTAWLMQSTYVTAVAVKNKTFLDTLSQRRLYAQCLADLTMNYLAKMKGYDNLSMAMIRKILSIDIANVSGLMLLANYYRSKVMTMAEQVGNPPLKDLEKYPNLFAAYQEQNKYASLVKKTGYQEMPKEAYERWLKTMEEEKEVREAEKKAEKLKLEINNLNKVPISIKSNPTF